VKLFRIASSGFGFPWGGIIPERSFRTTFSQTSASAPTLLKSIASSDSPAVLSVWLWQVTQYWLTTDRY
jgi:hypothetical protein